MCDRGRLRYAFTSDETRIREARVQEADEAPRPVPLSEALDKAATLLASARIEPNSVALLASAHLTNEESFRLATLAADNFAESNVLLPIETGPADGFLIQEERAPNGRGAREMGLIPRGMDLQALWAAIADGTVKTLYVIGSDLLKIIETDQLSDELAKLDALIVQDSNESPLTAIATVVLPGLTFAEKDGSFTNYNGRVQRIRRALEPTAGLLSDGEIFAGLEARLSGNPERPFSAAATLEEIADSVAGYAGMSFASLGSTGVPVAGGQEPAPPPSGGARVPQTGEA